MLILELIFWRSHDTDLKIVHKWVKQCVKCLYGNEFSLFFYILYEGFNYHIQQSNIEEIGKYYQNHSFIMEFSPW
jgi:hypothetical protein